MREEVISSGGIIDPMPAASSAGASSPAVQNNIGSIDWSGHGHGSKAASLSYVGSQPPRTSLSSSAGGTTLGSSRPSCRPWERGDLLRRLATFKPSNWLGKPKVSSSLACAQRGWMNVDVDKIACESCGAYLSFVILPSWTPTEVKTAGEVFAKQLDSAHRATCPWRGNGCPESLVQFPPTPQPALIGGYKDRCDGLLQFQFLPVVAEAAIEQIQLSRGPQVDRLLSQPQTSTAGEVGLKSESIQEVQTSRERAFFIYSRAQRLISLCGWEPRWLPSVQDCEEHSAQSAREGYSFGPTQAQIYLSRDPGPSKNGFSSAIKKDTGKNILLVVESRRELQSPLLDCSLCGATVRILDFLTVPRPSRFVHNNIDIPDTSKKMGLTRGVSAASGISGRVAADDTEREQIEDPDEVATTDEEKVPQNMCVDLNLIMTGDLPSTQMDKTSMSGNIRGADMGKDLIIGQPEGSEVGDCAASFESRGTSSRKRNLQIDGSLDDRSQLRVQHVDSVEGTVIDRDGEEVTDGRQYSAGPSKRARDSDIYDTYGSLYQRDSSVAGPSNSVCFDTYGASFRQGSDHIVGILSVRESTRASSVIAMDTACHSADGDSMESVENQPGNMDDAYFPFSSTYGNLDVNETSDLNYSNQAQQSRCFQPAADVGPSEIGVSSTNVGEEIFNAGTGIVQVRDKFSFKVSGGSVGMCASHEAEIRGADVSFHRTNSVVGDVEPKVDAENQGQTGESVPGPGLMDEIVPDEINREDPNGDSGSKIYGSAQDESVESGEKISQSCKLALESSARPSLSCNACFDYEATKKEVTNGGKSCANNFAYLGSDVAFANGIGPPKGESNYEEAVEFDPIIHHNQFCPWVNGNVAAAGSSSGGSTSSSDAFAFCGWQLTLDALDALRSLEQNPIQAIPSESAASLYKADHQTPAQKLLRHQSMSKSHGKH